MKRILLLFVLFLLGLGTAFAQCFPRVLMTRSVAEVRGGYALLGDCSIYDYDSAGRIASIRWYSESGELVSHLRIEYDGCTEWDYRLNSEGEWELSDKLVYLDSSYLPEYYLVNLYKNIVWRESFNDNGVSLRTIYQYDSLGREIYWRTDDGDTYDVWGMISYKNYRSVSTVKSYKGDTLVSRQRYLDKNCTMLKTDRCLKNRWKEIIKYDKEGRQVKNKTYYKGRLETHLEYEYCDKYYVTINRRFHFGTIHYFHIDESDQELLELYQRK